MHTLDFGFSEDAGASALFGYDLDGVYTCCDGGPESCVAAVTGATHCDDPAGRDNSGGHMIESLAAVDPSEFNSANIAGRLLNGTYSVLLQVLDYNGQANDTQVTVGLYGSDGVEGDAGALWNGADIWTIDDSFVVTPDGSPLLPNHFDAHAYVAGGILVMQINFPLLIVTSPTNTFTANLTAGVLTGRIVPAGNGTYSLAAGMIAGRWNVSDFLGSLQTLQVLGQPLCQGNSTYSFVKQQACEAVDIMTNQMNDRTGQTCDALSFAAAFTADPAQLGGAVAGAAQTSPCSTQAPDNCSQ
jgi:hypothetical protein